MKKDIHESHDLVPITGKRKALLIGINYFGTKNELRGCINDVKNLREFINTRHFNETPETIRVLTDDSTSAEHKPTKENILKGIDWLVHGAHPGDHLFFHYSGHGSQVKDLSGDEEDGFDETLVPLDFQKAGQIVDDELHDKMVKPLTKGIRLTAIFDCCHSGTVLDLPFVYKATGQFTEKPGEQDKGVPVAAREVVEEKKKLNIPQNMLTMTNLLVVFSVILKIICLVIRMRMPLHLQPQVILIIFLNLIN